MHDHQEARIPFYKHLFEIICYLSTFKDIDKNAESMNNFLSKLNSYTNSINECLNNTKEIFQGSVPYLKLFSIEENEIHLKTPTK